jgi:HPt (histidine-containing phosphotransfer) domain-containing protein
MSEDPFLVNIEPRLARLTTKFLAHCSRNVHGLRAAAAAGDMAAARRIGHSLSGTASSYGFAAIAALGEAVDAAAAAGDAAQLAALAESLEQYLARVQVVVAEAGGR